MIYKVTTETAIRNYLAAQIADSDSHLASIPPLSPSYSEKDREDDIRMYENSKKIALDSLALLETALNDGNALKTNENEIHDASFGFAVREDGMIRCFACDDFTSDIQPCDGKCDIDHLFSTQHGVQVAIDRLNHERSLCNPYGVAYYTFVYAYKSALNSALELALKNGAAETSVTIDGEPVKKISAVLEDNVIKYHTTPVFHHYFS